MANGVTSQWEDLQVKHGNYEAREKQETLQENYFKNQEKIENYDPLANKDLKDLEELEDELDEAFFEQYKQQRLKQLQELSTMPKYGSVIEINREDYIEEVTKASNEVFVVLHMYQDYIEECVLINQLLNEIAKEKPTVKFVKIVATKCVEKFPDTKVPCFLIYRNGQIASNLPMVHKYLKKITFNALEYLLKEQGVFNDVNKQGDEDNEEQLEKIKNPYKGSNTGKDEDPVDDREYSNNQKYYKKYM